MLKKILGVLLICLFITGCNTQIVCEKSGYEVISVKINNSEPDGKKSKYKVELDPRSYGYLSNCFFNTLLYTDEEVLPGDVFKLKKEEKNE
jgi:hypothetical protein